MVQPAVTTKYYLDSFSSGIMAERHPSRDNCCCFCANFWNYKFCCIWITFFVEILLFYHGGSSLCTRIYIRMPHTHHHTRYRHFFPALLVVSVRFPVVAVRFPAPYTALPLLPISVNDISYQVPVVQQRRYTHTFLWYQYSYENNVIHYVWYDTVLLAVVVILEINVFTYLWQPLSQWGESR